MKCVHSRGFKIFIYTLCFLGLCLYAHFYHDTGKHPSESNILKRYAQPSEGECLNLRMHRIVEKQGNRVTLFIQGSAVVFSSDRKDIHKNSLIITEICYKQGMWTAVQLMDYSYRWLKIIVSLVGLLVCVFYFFKVFRFDRTALVFRMKD